MRATAWLVPILLLPAAGCGRTKPPLAITGNTMMTGSDAGPGATGGSPGAAGTPGGGGSTPASTTTVSLTVDGHARRAVVHLPPNLRASTPLVLSLHGSGGTAEAQQASVGMDGAADANGFIVAYAEGGVALGGGFAWNIPGVPLIGGAAVPADAPDDIRYLGELVSFLEQRYSIDPKRVYATGMSGGGRMSSQVGCGLASVLAAVAPVAGLRFPSPCSGTRAVPVVAFHGTADGTNPYDGNGEAYWTYSVPTAAERWAAHDSCAVPPEVSDVAPNVHLTAYHGCAGGAEVRLYTIDGAGHEWPGAPGQSTAQAATIDATAVMWRFFVDHPLP